MILTLSVHLASLVGVGLKFLYALAHLVIYTLKVYPGFKSETLMVKEIVSVTNTLPSLSGTVVRVSVFRLGSCGFDPQLGHI